METTPLKNLINKPSNKPTIPGLKTKQKPSKQEPKQKQENSEDCSTKKLYSLPSSVLTENFTENIKKENLEKSDNSKNQTEKSAAKRVDALLSHPNPLRNILTENAAKNSEANFPAVKNSLSNLKQNLASPEDEAANKLFANERASLKDLNVSKIDCAKEQNSKLNLNSLLACKVIASAAAYSNSKNNENLISLHTLNNNNFDNYYNNNSNNNNFNLNANANTNKKQILKLNAPLLKNETEQLSKKAAAAAELTVKTAHSNQIQIPEPAESLISFADPIKQLNSNSAENNSHLNHRNLDANANIIIPETEAETLCVVPKPPKSMKVPSYIQREVPIYSNLYPIKLTKEYSLFTYFLDFQGDSEHINTFLKRKIISKAYLDLIPIFGIYFISGDNFYATEKVKDVTNIISTYNKVKYSFLIRPVGDFFEVKDYDANLKNKSLFKNILELIYKDILKANPDVKMIKNMCGKKCTEKVVTSRDNKVLVIPAFSTKIMLLEAGIFLNVDNKNKILNADDCLKLIKMKIKIPTKPSPTEIRLLNDAFRDKIVEMKHTNQRMKIDSISFDRTPKNSNLNIDGKT